MESLGMLGSRSRIPGRGAVVWSRHIPESLSGTTKIIGKTGKLVITHLHITRVYVSSTQNKVLGIAISGAGPQLFGGPQKIQIPSPSCKKPCISCAGTLCSALRGCGWSTVGAAAGRTGVDADSGSAATAAQPPRRRRSRRGGSRGVTPLARLSVPPRDAPLTQGCHSK